MRNEQVVLVSITDVERIAPLFDAYRQFYGQQPNLEGARDFLLERLKRGESTLFAVMDGDTALGFTQLYPSFSSVSMKPIWILNDLYVIPEARGRGVGASLLRTAREHAKKTGAKRLCLTTGVKNLKAQSLYERDGWTQDESFYQYEYELS
ncbi:MAG: GNAT family N-acetyltransferase [Gemmataceae bacterium]